MTQTALIIDDNALNLETLGLLLKKEGVVAVKVQYVQDLADTLDTLGQIAVVFLDLEFPNHHGYALLTELRKDARLNNVPIVAYTVHTSEQNEAREAGFHSFIGKPLQPKVFPDQLRRILRGEPVWEA